MKIKLLFGVIGLIVGILGAYCYQRLRHPPVRLARGCFVICHGGTDVSAHWSKSRLDLSYYQEGGKTGSVPAEVTFNEKGTSKNSFRPLAATGESPQKVTFRLLPLRVAASNSHFASFSPLSRKSIRLNF